MRQATLIKVLEQHSIEYTIDNAQVFGIDVSTLDGRVCCEWVRVDNINVYHWLGY